MNNKHKVGTIYTNNDGNGFDIEFESKEDGELFTAFQKQVLAEIKSGNTPTMIEQDSNG